MNARAGAALARLMVQDEGSSSSVTSSPLHNFSNMPLHPAAAASPTPPWMVRELRSDERGLCLIHLLLNCAAAAAAGRLDAANAALEHIASLAAPDGDAMQRVAAAFAEALARRALRAWPGLCRALLLPRASPTPAEVAAARRHFLDLCPFLRLAGAAANQSILEAMESEKIVHVIDLGGADATQWLELLHLLAARPEGPPHLRLTSVHEHKELLTQTAMALTKEAERLDVPFQFNPVVSRLDALDVESLRVKTGEALAICSSLQLHCLLASDDDAAAVAGGDKERRSPESGLSPSTSRADAFLGALWGLSPKVMVVAEQEAGRRRATSSSAGKIAPSSPSPHGAAAASTDRRRRRCRRSPPPSRISAKETPPRLDYLLLLLLMNIHVPSSVCVIWLRSRWWMAGAGIDRVTA
uniref:Uncharacterized protein n=1 Tax=Oryza rufipogon TaxID=4529 RepID=A0A0E0N7L6_ORYRU